MRVRRVLERGHHAEVAASAPQGPEQVGVLVRARAQVAPVGGDELAGDEVVDRHAVCAALVGYPPESVRPAMPVSETTPPGTASPNGLRLAVDVGPRAATLRPDGAPLRIDADAAHPREVDHHAVVADCRAGDVVPAAAHRQGQVVLPREVHGGDDVGHAGTHDDERAAGLSIIPFQTRRASS